MKTQTMLICGGLVVAAGAAFYFWSRRQGDYTLVTGPGGTASPLNPNILNQPAQQYPYNPALTTRQDTASQPWYGGARPNDASGSLMDPNLLANIQTVNALSTGTKSIGEIWDNLGVSSWFSDPAPVESDAIGDWDWNWSNYNA